MCQSWYMLDILNPYAKVTYFKLETPELKYRRRQTLNETSQQILCLERVVSYIQNFQQKNRLRSFKAFWLVVPKLSTNQSA